MKKFFVVLCLLSLVGCKSQEEKRIEAGEAYIASQMKDPTSVLFNSFYKSVGDNDGHLCGTVNAKNSYGAYTGANYFYVYLMFDGDKIKDYGRTVIVKDVKSDDMERYRSICG